LLLRRLIRSTSAIEKNQLKYVLIGLFIAIIGGITNFFLALGGRIFPLGNITEITFIGMTSLAIVKYHLMDIDVIIRPGIVYGILTGIITASWLTSIFIFEGVFGGTWSRILGLFICIFIFNVLRDRVQYLIDRLFYREKQELAEASSRIAKEITATIDPDLIATGSIQEIYNTLHPKFLSLFLLSDNKIFYELKTIVGDVDKNVHQLPF